MRILFEIGHPAQVHTMRNAMLKLSEKGHITLGMVKEREGMVRSLCNSYGIKYADIGSIEKSLFKKAVSLITKEINILKVTSRFKPDLFFSYLGYSGPVAFLTRKPNIAYTDTEPLKARKIQHYLFLPFPDVIMTPEGFGADLGRRQIRVKFYKEIAYLHPNWFKPNPSIYDALKISKNEKYAILRFNSFDASHDIGMSGFSLEQKRRLVKLLEKHVHVFISSESTLPDELKDYAFPAPWTMMHDALNYASLVIADSTTIITESAVLGTPAVYSSTYVKYRYLSNFEELEHKYGLVFNVEDGEEAIQKAINLIQSPSMKMDWRVKRERLLKDKIDFTAFLIWFVDNYPESVNIMRENPDYQERFK